MARHSSNSTSSEDDRRRRHRGRDHSRREDRSSRRHSRRSTSPHERRRHRHRSHSPPARPSTSHPRVDVVLPGIGMAAFEGFGRGSSLEKILCTCRHCKGVVLQTRSQVRSHLGNHGLFRPPPAAEVRFNINLFINLQFVLELAFLPHIFLALACFIHVKCGLFLPDSPHRD